MKKLALNAVAALVLVGTFALTSCDKTENVTDVEGTNDSIVAVDSLVIADTVSTTDTIKVTEVVTDSVK